ncbi:hypothetical protein M431DRAFT_231529 [Trichoderma harzianum CBS 226.95]|uniref:Uncharacterized protein n=1 Tax=Trichoderma harzianum CBS 226.95 TaxID=983964 RepID=A0A2T4A1V4_TRIHA|nr:hypothetical protein M431DRAFT_231529 [Trichoderma harzianum CBS 226.95]PTB51040.1 hypothetical protein M431DRAFT_231529 [Trichoderma harzianum CBS 226.95]
MLNMYFGLCLFEAAFLLSLMPLSKKVFISLCSPFFYFYGSSNATVACFRISRDDSSRP